MVLGMTQLELLHSLWADSGRSPAGQGESRHRFREFHAVTFLARRAEVSSELMLQLYGVAPVSDEEKIVVEAKDPPSLTTDLAAALAEIVRAALARRAERTEKAA